MSLNIKFPFNFQLKRLLYNKKFTVTISIILAFMLWLVIMINQKPIIDVTFSSIPVKINLENTYVAENGMDIIGDISNQNFSVKVQGPNYIVSSLKAEDIGVYASAATVDQPGEYKLEVGAMKNTGKSGFEIISVSPQTVTVNFDYIDTKSFTITALADGATAEEGLIAESGVVSGIESDSIEIKGPRTVLNNIDTVVAYSSVNQKLSSSKTFDAKIKIYDINKNEIDAKNLTFNAEKVKVTVPISKKKVVPVKAEFSNLPSGFLKDSISYSVNHSSVTLIGTPETIDKINSLSLSAIDITNISTASKSFEVSPKLPDGVRLLDSIDSFLVSINTSGYSEKVFNISKVKYTGVSSGLNASGDSAIKNVKICGPRFVLNKLRDDMLYAEVDLTDKKSGEHTVTVSVKSDSYNNIWQVGTYKTTVTIK